MKDQKKILELCETALNYEAHDREAFLVSVCEGDSKLKAAVESLLGAVDESNDFMPVIDVHREYLPADQIGTYTVVRKIGSGGMGDVYLAERDVAGYAQRVALKILRTHLLSSDMIALFDEERRTLARLNHPYIASLIDGGTTEDGLPYLVMEVVEGEPIDSYCDERRLTIKERLELLQKAALGVQSAHQNLIVHSDLKPNNILITADGIPKLLDFGIARLLRKNSVEESDNGLSKTSVALTPDYASPEHLSGGVVTTASDIYSLGVLTYELLVGKTPYHVDSVSRDELAASVTKDTYVRPSTQVRTMMQNQEIDQVAQQRRVSPTKMLRLVSGDLDAVLSKALAMDPSKRYTSASAFAEDLVRCGKGLPVQAHGDSFSYRLAKFVSRNRISVVAGSVAVMALLAGSGISMWQAQIAKQRFDDLHGFAESMIFDLHDEISEISGSTAARQQLTKEALHYLDRLSKDAAGDRELQLNLSMAYKRMGDVLGNPTEANLGDVDSAVESYHKALAIVDQLSRSDSANDTVVRHKAIVHEKLGDVLAWRGEMDIAVEHASHSLSLFKRLMSNAPDSDKAIMSVAISFVKNGDLLGHPSFPNAGDTELSLAQYQQALKTIKPLALRDDSPDGAVRYLALIFERLGTMESERADFDVALQHFQTSLHVREELAAEQPANATIRRDVAIAYEKVGDVMLASGDANGSLPHYNKALVIYRELAKSDPDNTHAQRTLAIGLENLGDAQVVADNQQLAFAIYDEALAIRRELASDNPENQRFSSELTRLSERVDELR